MLLESSAATWWQGIKPSTKDWQNAVNILRDVYSKKLPPHAVFRELFVAKFQALIAQLPYSVAEEIQLDMVYGLLFDYCFVNPRFANKKETQTRTECK
ncbi:hypothetical protein Zmor_004707 [Zophobas morio]|uniref:Uncharacterized protein n=1 Tax=Zophobas morio TaxID=2755281 RepID=A0AA38ITZ2_9CUCU|nr:hypothetical protein Zmor_004707 [Zophobas morio]